MFLTAIRSIIYNENRLYNPGPSKFWRRRRILRLSAHYFGRRRNCYRIALVHVQRGLLYSTIGKKQRSSDLMKLHAQRVSSGAEELGMNMAVYRRGLESAKVCLNNRSLSDLAIWEPRTFKALGNFAWNNYASQGFGNIQNLGNPPEGVVLRGLRRMKIVE
ncbi:39S ribosomal protein L20, mitochondrial [Frankliniella fusca]|uniref:39S ribosomal protein L20, mitochondrial n=1 Tax=Frankliniella fusca TaxID=407009 RepID=A0AAE1LFW6_9NEOP|nr:39S ribosomal protein L20, mitochondrial [Frankliniella fusca]